MRRYEAIYQSLPSVEGVKRVPVGKKKAFSTLNAKQSLFHALVAASDQ